MPTIETGKLSVGKMNTVPDPHGFSVEYTKGSGPWSETFLSNLNNDSRFRVISYSPAYEQWHVQEKSYPWTHIPIVYKAPAGFGASVENNRWERAPKENIQVQLPIHGFTRSKGWGVWADAKPHEFRAIVETLRFIIDFTPMTLGLDRFSVLFPQHLGGANIIAGAHYLRSGNALLISHETGIRDDRIKKEGGFAASNIVPHYLDAIDVKSGKTKIVAISSPVKEAVMKNASVPEDRIEVVRNPYNENMFFSIPGLTREQFVKDVRGHGVNFPDGVPMDGRWAVFVGRGEEFKGVEQLLHSWAVHVHNDKEATAKDVLFVVGPRTDAPVFQNLAKELGIEGHVKFMGGQEPDIFINPLHNVSNLAVMSSLGEGDGVVVKEPCAAGQRIVLPRSGGPVEYFHPDMGIMVTSRDPKEATSSMRGYELLSGQRYIKWGDKKLKGSEIVRNYLHWFVHYSGGMEKAQENEETRKRIELLTSIVGNWDSPEIAVIRKYAADVLEHEGREMEQKAYIPEQFRNGHDPRLKYLAEAFRAQGGRDVETHALAEGYALELNQPSEARELLSARAREYVVKNFASKPHAKALGDLLEEAASRGFSAPLEPASWDSTVVNGFKEGAVGAFASNIPASARRELREAFEQMKHHTNDRELVESVASFQRAAVGVLGNPETYQEKWPSPSEMAMSYDQRTANVLANVGGFAVDDYMRVRTGIAAQAAVRPELQQAFYNTFTGRMNQFTTGGRLMIQPTQVQARFIKM
jgi:glycosyltransferase involved in cell wall biosynthesis